MTSTSRAVLFEGVPGHLRLVSYPTPSAGAGELVVRVLGCTLCGSDLHSFHGRRPVAVPTILGHEIVGEIVDIGAGTPKLDARGATLAIGDHVTWGIVASCGRCFYCRRGLPQKCLSSVKYGHEAVSDRRVFTGGLADHCVLSPGSTVVRYAHDLPLEVICPANCATATVAAAVEAAGEIRDARVGISGAGLLGLTAAALCKERGAEAIIVTDLDATRRSRATDFGACAAPGAAELEGVVRERTEGHGVDVWIELSGANDAVRSALTLMRIGGTIVLVGAVFTSPPVPIIFETIVRRQLTIRGVHNYSARHLVEAVNFLEESHQRFPFAQLVASWHGLDLAEEAFRTANQPAVIRAGVRPTLP